MVIFVGTLKHTIMNREIKFRAWATEDRRMYYNVQDQHDWNILNGECFGELLNNVSYELMQFTGLKDSRGVEIYEGDIIHLSGFGLYECVFPFIDLYEANWSDDIGEIKGNVFENPELLEGDE